MKSPVKIHHRLSFSILSVVTPTKEEMERRSILEYNTLHKQYTLHIKYSYKHLIFAMLQYLSTIGKFNLISLSNSLNRYENHQSYYPTRWKRVSTLLQNFSTYSLFSLSTNLQIRIDWFIVIAIVVACLEWIV